jgi:cell wall-associated NlpC family hydrolase
LRPIERAGAALVFCAALGAPAPAAAQHQLELRAGRWVSGRDAATYELRSAGPLAGPLSHGVVFTALIHDSLGRRRAFYGAGYELLVRRPTHGVGTYGVLGVALGLSTDPGRHELGAHWSVGAGVEWRLMRAAALGVEARYRVEDRGPRGFWDASDARTGLSWSLGLTVAWGGRGGRGRARGGSGVPSGPPATPQPPLATAQPVGGAGLGAGSGPAAGVVRTALDALGSPYQWGGTAENGFDCSGLIQYAYRQYGVRLPRTSREQARAGQEVPPVVEALVPGDILLFASNPGGSGGVSHVGTYVGEGRFIHSAATGVRLSRLDYADPNGAHWLRRWVGARRVLP